MEKFDPNRNTQQTSTRRFGMSGGVLGGILGAATAIFTLLGTNRNSRVDAFKSSLESNPLNTTGGSVTDAIFNLTADIKSRFSETDLTKAADRAVSSLKAIQKKGNLSKESKAELKDFLGSSPDSGLQKLWNFVWPKGKAKGVVNTTLRAAGATTVGAAKTAKGVVSGTAEGLRRVAFDVTNVKGQKKRAATDAKIKKVGERFEKEAISAAAEASDTKIKMGDYAKNTGIAIVVGAVVMGATMAVSTFMKKRKERINMEKYAESLAFEREAAMMNPQTQISSQI